MNRKKIDMEKAYDIISDAPNSESNAIMNFWKGCFADPGLWVYNCSRVDKNESRANEFYRKALELDIEEMAEAGDKYACTCLGEMYRYGNGVDQITQLPWNGIAKQRSKAMLLLNIILEICIIMDTALLKTSQ